MAGFRPVFVDCEISKTDVGSSSVEVREKRVSIHFHLDSDNVRYLDRRTIANIPVRFQNVNLAKRAGDYATVDLGVELVFLIILGNNIAMRRQDVGASLIHDMDVHVENGGVRYHSLYENN